MNEIEVDDVQPKCPLAGREGLLGLALLAITQFRRHEDLIPRNSGCADRGPDGGLVVVRSSCVDVPVARVERALDRD